MTTTKTQTRRIDGVAWNVSELAEILGLSEDSIRSTPGEVLKQQLSMKEDLEQAKSKAQEAERKASKAKAPKAPKKSELQKFKERGMDTNMSAGVSMMLQEFSQGIPFHKDGMSTTHYQMSRRYGVPVMATLYQEGWLSEEANRMIESYYERNS